MINKCVVFMLCLFLSPYGFSCSPVVIHKSHITIIEMKGKKYDGIEYLESIGWLRYTGPERFVVMNEEKVTIATIDGGILCTFNNGNASCSKRSGDYLNINYLNGFFEKNAVYRIYIKVGDNQFEKFTFRKAIKRDSEEYQGQRMLAAVQSCDELELMDN